MTSLVITIGIPRGVAQNDRSGKIRTVVHKSGKVATFDGTKARATKASRANAKLCAIIALATAGAQPPRWTRATGQALVYLPKGGRRRDAENWNAGMKGVVDGFQDAGILTDDRDFHWLPPEFSHDWHNPRVEIHLTGSAGPPPEPEAIAESLRTSPVTLPASDVMRFLAWASMRAQGMELHLRAECGGDITLSGDVPFTPEPPPAPPVPAPRTLRALVRPPRPGIEPTPAQKLLAQLRINRP